MVLAILLSLLSIGYVSCLQCDTTQPQLTGVAPNLPHLPDQYETRVEANIKQKGRTVEVVEYYDYLSNRAAINILSNGKSFISIINFKQMERYDVHSDNSCKTTAIDKDYRSIFGFTAGNGSVHVDTVSDILKFGKQFGETYMGRTEIRGIPVDHWRSCQHWDKKNSNFTLDYFFTTTSYHTATTQTPIPVRAVLNGTAMNVDRAGKELPGTHNFSHVYDFVFFRPGPIKDQTVFEVPTGIICKGRKPTLAMPKLPDQFSVTLEIDAPHIDRLTAETISFDYGNGLIRTDRLMPEELGHKMTWIEDFHSGMEYVIDFVNGNCTVNQINNGSFGTKLPAGGGIKMRHAEEILKYNNRTYIYQGERFWRGLLATSWANLSSDGIVQEIMFLKTPSIPTLKKDEPVLVGLYVKNVSDDTTSEDDGFGNLSPPHYKSGSEKFVHFYNYLPTHADLDTFDISLCYLENEKKHITLSIEGDYDEDVKGSLSKFYTTLRTKLAKFAGISPLRITALQIAGDSQINILFTILDKSTVPSDESPDLDKAVEKLMTDVKLDPQLVVKYPHITKKFVILTNSVAIVTASRSSSSSEQSSYSSGAMAGISIGMFIVGLTVGIITAFIIYKRHQNKSDDSTVPYTRNKE